MSVACTFCSKNSPLKAQIAKIRNWKKYEHSVHASEPAPLDSRRKCKRLLVKSKRDGKKSVKKICELSQEAYDILWRLMTIYNVLWRFMTFLEQIVIKLSKIVGRCRNCRDVCRKLSCRLFCRPLPAVPFWVFAALSIFCKSQWFSVAQGCHSKVEELSVPKSRNRRKIAAAAALIYLSNRKVQNRKVCRRSRRKITRKSPPKIARNKNCSASAFPSRSVFGTLRSRSFQDAKIVKLMPSWNDSRWVKKSLWSRLWVTLRPTPRVTFLGVTLIILGFRPFQQGINVTTLGSRNRLEFGEDVGRLDATGLRGLILRVSNWQMLHNLSQPTSSLSMDFFKHHPTLKSTACPKHLLRLFLASKVMLF